MPTLWGWLVLLVVLALAALIAGRALYPFLAINEPRGGKILVIEGWMDPEGLDQAAAYAWVLLFFHPPAPGSHQERWAVAPAR